MKLDNISRNSKEMTLKLRRIDVCDLLLACTMVDGESVMAGKETKWSRLHQMLMDQLDAFDAKIDAEETESKPEEVNMKFKKVSNVYLFSKYIREDGKYTIIATDRENNRGTLRTVFVVYDENGNEIDEVAKLKDAKEKYSK
ncbi:MAG: hypothetical protein IIY21_00990 [Clostridiales bacterium]|nr:hypothetical protein [Clostridiales bacterium]MBQ1571467.1 hypothetical protein [Clostridiales bacterium]